MSEVIRRRRRSDADRSAGSILKAAKEILAGQPNASVEEIADAAAVSRQTVYAHFKSREGLVSAVVDAISAETVAEMAAVDLADGSASDALARLLATTWAATSRYSLLLHSAALAVPDPSADRRRHVPVVDYLEQVITRGQASGEFHCESSAWWLATAVIALGHAAGEAVAAGRLPARDGMATLVASALRLCQA
ncbi:hypothetical protein ALI144C_18435 [Actinosynnema sp. ALI-1.44]|uniref:TetR/AcrR family transcriptional regulator n=1 Tax=Actinosynnema sp. ALI-1.44 TaxID=1933779 RepID=UPI00097C44BD|nr:TetR/AcrR family transcriptional regulator [Actinosynnema sp. ALI-1.44]ONI83021.1 hypothetical protein ALI144C_18435 [Actinosynnema sp. ALI-1.44]